MHIPDGFLDPKMSGGLMGAAVGALAYCVAKVTQAVTEMVPQRVLAAAGNAMGNIQAAGHRALNGGGNPPPKSFQANNSLHHINSVVAHLFKTIQDVGV